MSLIALAACAQDPARATATPSGTTSTGTTSASTSTSTGSPQSTTFTAPTAGTPAGTTTGTPTGTPAGSTTTNPATVCINAAAIPGFLDAIQVPGSGLVIYCHNSPGGLVMQNDPTLTCLTHISHAGDIFPTTLCDP